VPLQAADNATRVRGRPGLSTSSVDEIHDEIEASDHRSREQ
jgi:hypothetical protein